MKKSSLVLTILIISISIFIYGVFVGTYKIFPYDVLDYVKVITLNEKNELNKNDVYYETDVSRLIHINTVDDIGKLKNNLIDFIWKYDGFPDSKLPNNVQKNIVNPLYDDFINLKQIDQIDVNMEYGINSIAYLFIPELNNNNHLIIYHEGHSGNGFDSGKKTIQFFLEKGYTVMAFSMPLTGMNSQPIVDLPNLGKFKMKAHTFLRFLDTPNFSPIKFFMEPITVSLNYLDKNYNFSSYNMVGFSGGGWTATLYSAIDDRIAQTYSVAGSVPIYLRTINLNLGDYEQWHPELYQIANYLDLYIMSSYGDDRGQLQIFNKYDPCCFSGFGFQTYEFEIKNLILKLEKGKFNIFLDEINKKHSISNSSLELILNDMRS